MNPKWKVCDKCQGLGKVEKSKPKWKVRLPGVTFILIVGFVILSITAMAAYLRDSQEDYLERVNPICRIKKE